MNAKRVMPLLYRDDDVAVVSKPSGMLVHRGWANDQVVAMTLLRNRLGMHVYPVHRLDRGTSGALVFALHEEAATPLCESFETGQVHKTYLALVRGITPEQGTINHALAPSKGAEKRPAQTDFRRLGTFERYSLVEARPLTGRLHQIRRHLKHISHPLIGDVRYGKGEHNRRFREEFGLHRLVLHASSVEFPHPSHREPVAVSAPLPELLKGAFVRMGLMSAD